MKKILFILLAGMICVLNSCREDGDWGENQTNGQFGFSIERDKDYIEKAVGETTDIKFNVKAKYDFSTIPMVIKYTSNLNGVLKLGDIVMEQNKEYDLKNADNILHYIGNSPGTHGVKISVKNAKDQTLTEEFELKYAVSEFTHTISGGIADIHQGDETQYLMKVVSGNGQTTTGYQIKFNSYNGTIKYNGVPATLETWYPIHNIDSFNISLISSIAGQGKLTYSIKNSTVNRDYEIQQTILARQIVIESLNINANSVLPNSQMSLLGVLKKSPSTSNTTIQYKTWISSASNNNVNGIQTTNNVYTQYALGTTGNLQLQFNAISEGNYTLNFQAKDEFGNESEIKSFNIVVEKSIQFIGGTAANIYIRSSVLDLYFNKFSRTLKIQSGGNTTITKVKYTINFDYKQSTKTVHYTKVLEETLLTPNNVYEVQNLDFKPFTEESIRTYGSGTFENATVVIEATNSAGQITQTTITPTFVRV